MERSSRSIFGLWLISLVAFSLLYLLTSQRGISWQDSGEYQWRVLNDDFYGPGGLARSHPLYIAMGIALKYFPGGLTGLPFKLNFFSGLGMAVALANLAGLILMVTGRVWIAFAGSAMVSVMHTVWWLSTIAEVYTWSVAGLTAELWLLILLFREPNWKYVTALALVNGLGFALHNLALLPLPAYAAGALILVRQAKIPRWSLLAAAAAFVVGASPYLVMIVEEAIRNENVSKAIVSALVGTFPDQVFNVRGTSAFSTENFVLIAQNFTSFAIPFSVIGFLGISRFLSSTTANLVRAIGLIELLFVMRYNVPDQFTFILPSLVMMGFFASLGIARLESASSRLRKFAIIASVVSVVLPPVFYGLSPTIAKKIGIHADRDGHPRDELRYWLTPWKHNERSARLFCEQAVASARPDGVILCNQTAFFPLSFYVTELMTGVSVQNSSQPMLLSNGSVPEIRKELGQRPIFALEQSDIPRYLVPYVAFEKLPEAVLFKVIWR